MERRLNFWSWLLSPFLQKSLHLKLLLCIFNLVYFLFYFSAWKRTETGQGIHKCNFHVWSKWGGMSISPLDSRFCSVFQLCMSSQYPGKFVFYVDNTNFQLLWNALLQYSGKSCCFCWFYFSSSIFYFNDKFESFMLWDIPEITCPIKISNQMVYSFKNCFSVML